MVLLGGSLPAVRAAPNPDRSLFPLEARWSTDLGAPAVGPPAFANQHAYVALRTGRLVAVSALTGTRRWDIEIADPHSVAAGDELVFVATARAIQAHAQDDGTLLWEARLEATPSMPIVWDGGWLIAGLADGTLVARRAGDGVVIWRRSVAGGLDVPPALAGE